MFAFILQVAKEFSLELSVLSFLSQCETCEKLPTIKKTAIGDYLRLLCCRIGEEQSLRLFKINLLSVAILSSSCNTSAAQLIWDIFSSQSLSSACTLVLCAKGRRLRPSEAAAVLLSSSSPLLALLQSAYGLRTLNTKCGGGFLVCALSTNWLQQSSRPLENTLMMGHICFSHHWPQILPIS